MRNRIAALASLALGVALGLAASYVSTADASRNGSGNYSLPSGNPVVTGTTISSTWANSTLSDLSTEVTSSLDRSGRGAMLAKLQLFAGTSAAPGLCFASDTDTGLWREGSNDIRMGVDSVYAQKWTTTGVTIPKMLVVMDGGVFITGGTDSTGVITTGTGTGNGILATGGVAGDAVQANGGSSSGYGVDAVGGGTSGPAVHAVGGSPNGPGVSGVGTGSGLGGDFTGGATGTGLRGTGGGSSATGVVGQGAAGGAGVIGVAGTAGSSGTRQTAIAAQSGDIAFTSSTNPTATVSISNAVTPTNVVKAWVRAQTDGAAGITLISGFNVTSVGLSGGKILVTFGADFASDNYACTATTSVAGYFVTMDTASSTAGTCPFVAWDAFAGGTKSFNTLAADTSIICVGAQ